MKKLAVAVLILFAMSLFGAAFASGCMAMQRASAMTDQAQVRTPPCCVLDAACMGGSCTAPLHNAGCTADAGAIAAGQKSQSANDLVKAPAPAIVPALLLNWVAHDVIARPHSRTRSFAPVAGYADIFARTGRLLI